MKAAKKSTAINAAIIVSDLHCGSSVGLSYPEAEQEAGNVVIFGKNHHQRWLWSEWMDKTEKARAMLKGANIVLGINGDATEGAHHGTAELIASKIEEHCANALQCLMPLRSMAQAVLVTKGTECHTRGMEDKLAADLQARTGKAQNKWLFEVNGCLVDMAHHMMTASRMNLEATQLSVTIANAKLNYDRAGHRIPRLFLRGHRHCGGFYDDGNSAIGVTGGWQFLTRHGHKVVTDSIPRPSMIVLDWRDVPHGELPRVTQLVSTPPQSEIERL